MYASFKKEASKQKPRVSLLQNGGNYRKVDGTPVQQNYFPCSNKSSMALYQAAKKKILRKK
jgi:hypothetical protein